LKFGAVDKLRIVTASRGMLAGIAEGPVPYEIKFGAKNRVAQLQGKIVVRETAIEAWAVVQHLSESDEVPSITDPSGEDIGWHELRIRAIAEAA
jgi:hypothetical protein